MWIYLFFLNLESESTVSLSDVNFLVEENVEENNADAVRRNSQGSLGQKYRSPDISATPTSPSAYSWCPESMVSTSISAKSTYMPSKKQTLKDKIFHNFRADVDGDNEEYCVPPSTFTRINQKIAVRSKMKLRSRTVNFLRQLKKPQSNQGPNSVVLLGVKKLESCSVACGIAKASRVPFALESGIRHSQSTLSVMSTLYTEGNSSIPNSESMPDLTSGFVPPPPPPPIQKSKHLSADISQMKSNLLMVNQDSSSVPLQAVQKSASLSHVTQTSSISTVSDMPKRSEGCLKSSSHIITNGDHNDKIQKASAWQESSDEVFDLASMKSLSNISSEPIVSSQPSKSINECIFDGVKKKKSSKFDPPPPISIISDELGSTITGSNVCEICPPSPPVQFKDPPQTDKLNNAVSVEKETSSKSHKKKLPVSAKSNTSWSNESCLTSIICQGTLFFPRPPAQFGDNITETPGSTEAKDDSCINSEKENSTHDEEPNESNCADSNLVINENLEEKNSKNLQKNTSFFDTKCTILEMLTDLSEPPESQMPLYASDSSCPDSLNSLSDRQRSYSLIGSNPSDEDAPSVRRASVIGTEMIRYIFVSFIQKAYLCL